MTAMALSPLLRGSIETTEKKIGSNIVQELTVPCISNFLSKKAEIQHSLSSMPLEKRLKTVSDVGKVWDEMLADGRLNDLRETLYRSTGYSLEMIDLELSLVRSALNGDQIRRNIETALPYDIKCLESFVDFGDGEKIRCLPAGPVFIISSGNSLIPPLIPTTISLVTGNLTILRPSLSNYAGVYAIYKIIDGLETEEADLLARALAISYFSHDSPAFPYLLSEAPLGAINFWGGEPARTEISKYVHKNPFHPRFYINGPLTGSAIIDEGSASESAAMALAKNIVLYDQQLCSSPTQAAFVGSMEGASEFAKKVCASLSSVGQSIPMKATEGSAYVLESARRFLRFKGSAVFQSNDPSNAWTVVLSKGKSPLDDVISASPEFNIYNRRRFMEISVVANYEDAVDMIRALPSRRAYRGIDKVQSVGLAVGETARKSLLESLAAAGVFRILPLEDMFMRSAAEPYDGIGIPSMFTYFVYAREKLVLG